MRLNPTTPIDVMMKRMCDGNAGAASVVGLLHKAIPKKFTSCMREMDRIGMYGLDIWTLYAEAGMDLKDFILRLRDGTYERRMKEINRQRGVK